MLWEAHRFPLPDVEAIARTIAAVRAAGPSGVPPDPADLGAALTVLRAARLDMGRLEVELLGTVHEAGLSWLQVAALLGLADAAAAEERYAKLRPLLDAPVDQVKSPVLGHIAEKSVRRDGHRSE
ncbi:hypothetical protein [Actinomadura gamaensis]|uniref:Uncharacterized protein n=1 Tax=Actinomadura gamaensis TaxID=1763541 RepID=A0ABV9TTW1_9ACTN